MSSRRAVLTRPTVTETYSPSLVETVVAVLKPFSLKAFAVVILQWDVVRPYLMYTKDASDSYLEQFRAFEGLESLSLEFFGSNLAHRGVEGPLPPSFQSLRTLKLSNLRIKRPALEQLINQSSNLEEANFHMIVEWADVARGEPCLHIKSRSLKHLWASKSNKAYLDIDALNLESLILRKVDRATLKAPNLSFLTMDSVGYLSAISLEHLKVLIFERPSLTKVSMLPKVLRCTPNLVRLNLSFNTRSTSVDELKMSSESSLLDYPRILSFLESDGRFLITLRMASIQSLVNMSISEIDVKIDMSTESRTQKALAKLKVLLETCADIKKLMMRPFNPSNARFIRELSLPKLKGVLEVEWPTRPKSRIPDVDLRFIGEPTG
jgi:hypothetical protein